MYEIRNDGAIYLYDEITGGMTARKLAQELDKRTGPVTLRINSQGGDVFEAITLYNLLKGRGEVTVYVDGVCASAASVIAMSGRVIMPSNTMMMIHEPATLSDGTSSEHADMAALLDKITGIITSIYAAKTGLDSDRILQLMKSESWMTAQEAVSLGFADEIAGERAETRQQSTYDEGVLAERARMKELDRINAHGREAIISRAKYETFQSAQDIALELLRQESRSADSVNVSPAAMTEGVPADYMTEIINKARGWK